MSSLLPNGKQHFDDNNGRPLVGGRVYYYIPNTSTPKNTWQDEAMTILNTNPIVLDARGECTAWGYGRYRQVVRDSFGNLIWDRIVTDLSAVIDEKTQGIIDDLAAPDGSSLVGFLQAGQGARPRNLQDKGRDVVSPADFGAIGDRTYHPLSERYTTLIEAQGDYPFVTSLSQSIDYAAIQAALNSLEGRGGIVRDDVGLSFVIAGPGLLFPESVTFDGAGNGFWDTVFPNRPKTWGGTNLFFYGTGDKTWSRRGVTSMQVSGGWREDPASPGTFLKLSSLMNSDASGGTPASPRTFSVAIRGKERLTRNWGLSNCRVVPWIGVDGYSSYSDQAYTGLADDWDIGILLEDAEWTTLYNVQGVGYWRQYGCALINSDFDVFGGQERNSIDRCKFQGLTGLSIRSGDTRAVAAKTSSTVEILWDNESFWEPSGTFTGFPASSFIIYTYTSLSRNGANLVFNGVTPDPTVQNINTIRAPKRSSGLAGTWITNTHVSGLDHTNGGRSTAYGLGDSTAFEMSGFPMRGCAFANTKVQSREKTLGHWHDCQDTLYDECQFEGSGYLIASPIAGASTAPAPSGDTRNLRAISTLGLGGTLFTPRSIFDDAAQFNRTGLNSGFDITSFDATPVTISSFTNGETIRFTDAGTVGIGTTNPAQKFQVATNNPEVMRLQRTAAGLVGMQYTNTNGSVSIRVDPSAANAGSFFSSGNGTVSCGTASFPWSEVHASTSTILPSDERLKKIRGGLSDAEIRAWARVAPIVYQFHDAIALKGEEEARLHFGYSAQATRDSFLAEGLDPRRYALFCMNDLVREEKVRQLVSRQKHLISTQRVEIVEILDGAPVLSYVDEEVVTPVFETLPLRDVLGNPVMDERGFARMHQVPVLETVEEEVTVMVAGEPRLGLRYEEITVWRDAYDRWYLQQQLDSLRAYVQTLESRVQALEARP